MPEGSLKAHPARFMRLAKRCTCCAAFRIHDRRAMPLKKSVAIGGVRFKAYRVQHSIRAPAVGYRVSAKVGSFFYLPDVAKLPNALGCAPRDRRLYRRRRDAEALDGAHQGWSIDRPRRHHGSTRLVRQGARAVERFSPIVVRRSCAAMRACSMRQLRQLGREHGIDARLACDGDRLSFPGKDQRKSSKRMLERA